MVDAPSVASVFDSELVKHGQICRLRAYALSYSGTDSDEGYVTQSGSDSWFYGMLQPVNGKFGGKDYKYLEQGAIKINDGVLYMSGSISIDDNKKYKIFLGSPALTSCYELVEGGNVTPLISGVDIYKKAYVRFLNGGSFVGQY